MEDRKQLQDSFFQGYDAAYLSLFTLYPRHLHLINTQTILRTATLSILRYDDYKD